MQYKYKLSRLGTLQLLAMIQLSALVLAMPAMVAAQAMASLRPFSSVELHGGGKAILRYGPTQRVTLLKGSSDYTRVMIADGGRLVIDNCRKECPRGYDLQIEIETPDINRISVSDGGTIESRGSFTRQAEIGVAVSQGGRIDIRSMAVDNITASVDQGGIIFTRPQTAMFAKVANGGNITYWGGARVKSSIKGGGVVTRGTAAEADKPLSELSPSIPLMVPVVPALPAIPPARNPWR
jgi:hypothetical protein